MTEERRKTEEAGGPAASGTATPASPAVRAEWGRRVEAEYRSAAIAQHLALWLTQIGASPDLIHDGLRISAEELVHAELSHEVFIAAGGEGLPPIPRESLAFGHRPGDPIEASVTRMSVDMFCLGETVAVPLFKVLREHCVEPVARKALDQVLKDEVSHREFGWTLLEYLLELPCETLVRELLDAELGMMFARLRRSYAPVGGEDKVAIPDADRDWGLMPIARYRELLDQTVERDYRPRFGRLNIAVDVAWNWALEQDVQAKP